MIMMRCGVARRRLLRAAVLLNASEGGLCTQTLAEIVRWLVASRCFDEHTTIAMVWRRQLLSFLLCGVIGDGQPLSAACHTDVRTCPRYHLATC
jgi:hypothetical protein